MSDVVIVGAGPAGLTAAATLARMGVDVRVVERDDAPGGVPRSSDHLGYGLRGARRLLSGPDFAARLADAAVSSGVRIDTHATVTDLDANGRISVTSPSGREELEPRAIVLATGCRERPRSARLVPGTRPAGVMTTGWLQRLVHLQHGSPGSTAIVVGAEHVSYSAVVTLAEAGCRTIAMITHGPAHTTLSAFDAAARARYRFPLLTRTTISAIHGRERVAGVSLIRDDGATADIECDTVIFTGDWYPENDLAIRAGASLATISHAPLHDGGLRTSIPGVFAAGNLLHPAITADRCAQDGDAVASTVREWLHGGRWPAQRAPIELEAPLLWSSPNQASGQAVGSMWLLSDAVRRAPRVEASQDGVRLWSGRVPWAYPTRPFRIPGDWLARARGDAPVRIRFN